MAIGATQNVARNTSAGGTLSFPTGRAETFHPPASVEELVDSEEYRLFCQGRLANPYGLLGWLRENDPVHLSPILNAWILTRYDDVFEAFTDKRFLYDRISASMSALPPDMRISCAPLGEHVSNWLGYTDPPKHTRLRGLLRTTFTPKLAKAFGGRITEIADNLLDEIEARGEGDLVADFAYPLPARVIFEILGIPEGDERSFAAWSDSMVAFTGHIGPTLVEIAPRAMASYQELESFFDGMVVERNACPAGDLITKLAGDEAEGHLSRQELIGLSVFTLVAGHESSSSLISTGARMMLDNDALRKALMTEPDLYTVLVEELLRLEPPIQFSPRLAGEDMPLRGKIIKEGQTIIMHMAAANRDPEHFKDPEMLDLERDDRHLAFGWGAHFCLGAPLAQLEGAIALERLFQRMPDLEPVDAEIGWRENMTIRGPKELWVQQPSHRPNEASGFKAVNSRR
jgi:cytochrome P450